LSEQLRDIMFHFEAQRKLADAQCDVAEGTASGGTTERTLVTRQEIEQAVIEIGPGAKSQRRKKKH
jgi:hypothetical protein